MVVPPRERPFRWRSGDGWVPPRPMRLVRLWVTVSCVLVACAGQVPSEGRPDGGGVVSPGGARDGGTDAGPGTQADGGTGAPDGGPADGGTTPSPDGGAPDAGLGPDAGRPDA